MSEDSCSVLKRKSIEKYLFIPAIVLLCLFYDIKPQEISKEHVTDLIKNTTKYLDENISVNGGYVWLYTPDFSRRWGEMEAFPSMAWVQGPGTVMMGNTFLDIYETTKDKYYLDLAEKTAHALIEGQLECGGWNYMIDFAGEESIKKWYDTIGKNGWRLEEFQHYYGNATFDDNSTGGAASFILRMYLTDPKSEFKISLEKTIDFILDSQYPLGGWPQRFPLKDKFNKNGLPDYTPYYTFNDNAIWNNIKFLITCYQTLGDEKLLEPIKKGMDFFLLTQQPDPQSGWGQQYSLDLKPAGARSYEPKSLDPQYTARHIEILIKFYQMTCDKKYIGRIEDALKWIESVKLAGGQLPDIIRVPKFVEVGTNKTIYTHRIGTNVKCGKYFFDYDSEKTLAHYMSIRTINIGKVKGEMEEVPSLNINSNRDHSIFIPGLDDNKSLSSMFNEIDQYLTLPSEAWEDGRMFRPVKIEDIVSGTDSLFRWLTPRGFISNPYIGEPACEDSNSVKYSETRVGDKYDTSPFPDTSGNKYLSTGVYIYNIHRLLDYLSNANTNK